MPATPLRPQLDVQYRQQGLGNGSPAIPGWYWAAWNSRNGHAEGGPCVDEQDAIRTAKAWERDLFE